MYGRIVWLLSVLGYCACNISEECSEDLQYTLAPILLQYKHVPGAVTPNSPKLPSFCQNSYIKITFMKDDFHDVSSSGFKFTTAITCT